MGNCWTGRLGQGSALQVEGGLKGRNKVGVNVFIEMQLSRMNSRGANTEKKGGGNARSERVPENLRGGR